MIISDIVLMIVEFHLQAFYLFLYNNFPFNSFKSSVKSNFVFLCVLSWLIFCFMHIPVGSTSPKINKFISHQLSYLKPSSGKNWLCLTNKMIFFSRAPSNSATAAVFQKKERKKEKILILIKYSNSS